MELYSMWGNHEDLAFDILKKGGRIGFTGGGDCHEGRCGFSVEDRDGQGVTTHTFAPGLKYRCGLTAALMPRLTRKALLRALRERKTYATTGARILLDFSVGGLSMGEEGPAGAAGTAPRVNGEMHACTAVDKIEVVKNGAVAHVIPAPPEDHSFSWEDPSGEPGWYVLRVTQIDGHVAWSSPVWVRSG
jgi:hypothetical protein